MSLVYKVCCGSLAPVRNETRRRAIKKVSVNVDNYEDGAAATKLVNEEKHIKAGGLLDWAKNKYSGGSSPSTINVYRNVSLGIDPLRKPQLRNFFCPHRH